MIVRTLDQIAGSPSDVRGETWESRRMLLSGDRMGFSLSDTIIKAGTEQRLHYKHHFEANYCIKGRGEAPEKPFSGQFVVRTNLTVHRQAALMAKRQGVSLNAWVTAVIETVGGAGVNIIAAPKKARGLAMQKAAAKSRLSEPSHRRSSRHPKAAAK